MIIIGGTVTNSLTVALKVTFYLVLPCCSWNSCVAAGIAVLQLE
jgi:hypothetical protein